MRLDVKGPLVVGGTSNGYRRIGIVPGGRSKENGCRAKSLKAAAIGRRSRATAQRRWTSDWSWGRLMVFSSRCSIGELAREPHARSLSASKPSPLGFRGSRQSDTLRQSRVACFGGYAIWTYLTEPIAYAYPGFIMEEIDPWEEDGETWRWLKAIFPVHIASQTRQQVSYFGPDGLMRRHDYNVDVPGGSLVSTMLGTAGTLTAL
jgi:hypothetical protein